MDEEKDFGHGGSGSKKWIHKSVIIVAGVLSLFLLAQTVASVKGWSYIGKETPPQSTITVSGAGEVVAVPDIATFSFGVTEESLIVSEAQSNAAKASNAILAYLKTSGIDEKDIKTTGYNIYPRYEYTNSGSYGYPVPNGKQTLAAYVVSQSFEVKIRKLSDAGKIIGGLGELGATNISGLTFGFDKDTELKLAARKDAINDAKKNADVLAGDLGVRLVRLVSYSESGYFPPVYATMSASAGGVRAATVPNLPVGENKITSNVTLTYEVQ